MQNDRIKNSVFNMLANLIPNLLLPVVGFFRIRLIVLFFGSGLNGLSQVFTQLLSFLQLSESGFGAAFNISLYKPLAEDDKKKVNAIYNANRHYQKIVSLIMMIGSFVMFFFMPLFIKDIQISFIEAGILFIVFSIPYIVNQFMNAKYILIRSMQKEYIFQKYLQTGTIIKLALSIIIIPFTNFFTYMMIDSLLYVLVYLISYKRVDKEIKDYIHITNELDKTPAKETKFVLAHRISALISYNTDSLVLSTSPKGLISASIYNAYMYIVRTMESIIGNTLMGPISSFGDMFAKKSQHAYEVFKESFYGTMFITSVICLPTFLGASEFVSLWMHDVDVSYQVSLFTVILFVTILYYRLSRRPILLVLESQNMFKYTSWGAALEAIVNLGISLLLVQNYGIVGVLIGTVISLYLVDFIVKGYYGCKLGLGIPCHKYFLPYFLLTGIFLLVSFLTTIIPIPITTSFIGFILKMSILTPSIAILFFLIYYICFKEFRHLIRTSLQFVKRVIHHA